MHFKMGRNTHLDRVDISNRGGPQSCHRDIIIKDLMAATLSIRVINILHMAHWPIQGQYSGHVTIIVQSEASILCTPYLDKSIRRITSVNDHQNKTRLAEYYYQPLLIKIVLTIISW